MRPDYSVYLVTDRPLCGGRALMEVVAQAVQGGVTMVQLREKHADTREFVELAQALLRVVRPVGVPLLINDRIDVAMAVGADGVHVGQRDMPYADARRMLGSEAIIGLSVESLEQAREAEQWDVDYFGVSPVFATGTKTDTGDPWGLEGLRCLRRASTKPLVGIGGLGPSNAEDVLRAGADGIAVVSAICGACDPVAAAAELRRAVSAAS
ncbi:thiamine phosphate synthase [Pseudodesulfovibrio senegalensis]|uniref:Thiamine-phosphate synthase n=1 Tax=Pseudodesulfovibrio senegalensis TaxID=1721087 RepID=A0A6N6MZN6_9BACT|nr:thiamine phosphate synthase [Pseudodesulfovibrio senegalensis]KAB1440277.1 thiamine phosphate synthase [Pseudodesulfovibrio senegalensis]